MLELVLNKILPSIAVTIGLVFLVISIDTYKNIEVRNSTENKVTVTP